MEPSGNKINVVWDMETGDPDDFLTLLLLLGHPRVNLKAVTVTPGSPAQIGVVRKALEWFGSGIPVGSFNIDHPKDCVSSWHYQAFGEMPPSRAAESGPELLLGVCDSETTLVTGGPLKNLGEAIRLADERGLNLTVGRLVAQGGFAGEGVVSQEKQLPKFRGKVTCPTYNFNGDPKAAKSALAFPGIGVRRLVSKNVCHGVCYDRDLHARIGEAKDGSRSLGIIWNAMDGYLRSHGDKKFHDPLAACCAIDDSIGDWREVEVFRQKGEWGSRLCPGSGTWIIVDYDREKFVRTLTES